MKSSEIWRESWRTDPEARTLADRHYNRQSPGATGFVPPGRCLVLCSIDARAFWVTSWPFAEYVKHDWPGAWVCSAFRNERSARNGERLLASDMIIAALACTVWKWPIPPTVEADGGPVCLVTFVDEFKVRRKREPGRCYRKAGFRVIGRTKGGLLALGIGAEDLPAPSAPMGSQTELF